MRNILCMILAAIGLSIVSCKNNEPKDYTLTPIEFAEKRNIRGKTTPVIDVRTPKEYAESALIDAANISWKDSTFIRQVQSYDKDEPILVYCRSGARSAEAAAAMRKEGFTEVYELDGGIEKWLQAGFGVEKH